MKKYIIVSCLLMLAALPVIAEEPMDDHTAREEAEGREVWQKLQSKELECSALSDEQFGALGEYFMGQMMGDAHSVMNEMITRMHGEEGEEQIHIIMGKRLSGCDTDAVISPESRGFMPMMNMMGGGMWSSPSSNKSNWGGSMMDGGSLMSYGFWGPLSAAWFLWHVLWWALAIGLLIWFLKWLMRGGKQRGESRALEMLEERYAKGEINKQEFDEKKKDLLG